MIRTVLFAAGLASTVLVVPHPRPLLPLENSLLRYESSNAFAVEHLSAGFGAFFGSITWVESVFAYAGILFDGDAPNELPVLFHWTAHLDTSWAYPRLIASWALPQIKGMTSRDALPFLEDGARRFPSEWKFRLTWAQYVLDNHALDPNTANDSAAQVLLPVSAVDAVVPQYARNLAFTLLHKNGRPEEAISLLLQTYAQVPDPMVRMQFRDKIGDLLERNQVSLGADSADFMGGIGSLLESKAAEDHALAGRILTALVDTSKREAALTPARQLATQFRAYRSAGAR